MVISNSSMQRVVDEVAGLGADYIVKADLSLKALAGRVERRLAARPAAPAAAAPAAPANASANAPAAETAEVKEKEKRILPTPKPVTDDETVECAGCGSVIGIKHTFCPKCGRQLDGLKVGRSYRPTAR
jgi:ribosomal protein L12E/L44/L45/RPP1/RPP2